MKKVSKMQNYQRDIANLNYRNYFCVIIKSIRIRLNKTKMPHQS